MKEKVLQEIINEFYKLDANIADLRLRIKKIEKDAIDVNNLQLEKIYYLCNRSRRPICEKIYIKKCEEFFEVFFCNGAITSRKFLEKEDIGSSDSFFFEKKEQAQELEKLDNEIERLKQYGVRTILSIQSAKIDREIGRDNDLYKKIEWLKSEYYVDLEKIIETFKKIEDKKSGYFKFRFFITKD